MDEDFYILIENIQRPLWPLLTVIEFTVLSWIARRWAYRAVRILLYASALSLAGHCLDLAGYYFPPADEDAGVRIWLATIALHTASCFAYGFGFVDVWLWLRKVASVDQQTIRNNAIA